MTTDLLPIPADIAPLALDQGRLQDLFAQLLRSAGCFTPNSTIPQEAHLQLQACATYFHYQHGMLRRGRIGIRMDQAAANWWTMVTQETGDPRSLSRAQWLLALRRLSELVISQVMPRIQAIAGSLQVETLDHLQAQPVQGMWAGVSCEEGSIGVMLEPTVVVEFPIACI